MSCAAVAYCSKASTTFFSWPALIALTAVATARSQAGGVRLPSDQRRPVGGTSGAGTGSSGISSWPARGSCRSAPSGSDWIVVSQAWPSRRPTTMRGITSTEPSDVGSKVKLPNATGPEPGTPTSSLTSALSNSSRSHFSPAANRSCPAVSVTFATVPQPTMPSPRRIQASACGPGSVAMRSPGSGMATVRTARRPGVRPLFSSCAGPTPINCTCELVLVFTRDLAVRCRLATSMFWACYRRVS